MSFSVIHTADPKLKHILKVMSHIAHSKATVLVHGESGTGKELLARYLHSQSSRVNKKFHAMNCAAVPENLLESELFGYEKGAFTGADQRKLGRFEVASGSTFLLDEISEMPLLLQAKLLRVIQESEVERLGGGQPIKVDLRLVATTNRSLEEMVKKGEFREDLFYRLNVIPIEIPPLRERPKDIELLSRLFIEASCNENKISGKTLTASAMDKLKTWTWPGNVRELQNVIERSILLCREAEVKAEDLFIKDYMPFKEKKERGLSPGMTVSEAEQLLILKTLEHTQQNRTRAARLLGISIRTLRNKINEYREMRLL